VAKDAKDPKANDPKAVNPAQLLRQLQASGEIRHVDVAPAGLEPRLALLRAWQSERLAKTYADLLADKRTRPAGEFFLSDIYGPRDFTQRDHDAERLHEILSRVVPAPMLQQLSDIIQLNRLTAALDQQLLAALFDQLGVTDTITAAQYAEGYRLCDNYPERVRQIDLIVTVLNEAAQGAHWPGAGVALKLAGVPARQAGWVELYEFLLRGYDAFKRIKDVKVFVATVEQRERRILAQIFSAEPEPFAV
jgi:hypothetical protein